MGVDGGDFLIADRDFRALNFELAVVDGGDFLIAATCRGVVKRYPIRCRWW